MSVRVESLVVGGEAAPWQRLGFVVVEGRIPLHGAGVRASTVTASASGSGS